mgnify:CR=1 FL=1
MKMSNKSTSVAIVAASTAVVVSTMMFFVMRQFFEKKEKKKEVCPAKRVQKVIWQSLPKRIIFLRHGESEGNVDHSVYMKKSDCQLELTKRGKGQARDAGRKLKRLLGNENIIAYVSPFERAKETLLCVKRGMIEEGGEHNVLEVHMDPRIREAERNNLQVPESEEDKKIFQEKFEAYLKAKKKHADSNGEIPHPAYPSHTKGTISYHTDMAERLGRFFYRRPNGESCADVYVTF